MKGYNNDYGGGNGGGGSEAPVNGVDYNSAGSSSVGKVDSVDIIADAHDMPRKGSPNSVTQNFKGGKLNSERYFGSDGKPYLDIDYTDHGNPKMHPNVPHQHRIWNDDDGNMHRDSSDTEVK